jgi:glutamine synthetase
VSGDGYAAAAKSGLRLPTTWHAAVDAFEGSAVMREYLGARFVDMFAKVKRIEQDRFDEEVSSLDYDWCLKNA